jgi:UDP-2-acetamido-3-amino-2,3-dideoxy-glucuronate N-acetyltransferase
MKRNIAVIGCGYWGSNLVRNFAQLGALHTICDADRELLSRVAAGYPEANAEEDYTRVLRSSHIKGIVVAAPAAMHYAMVRDALLAGKDCFVEKPLALKVAEGQELVNLARETDKILMVGHLLEYHPAVAKLKELVDRGELGKVRYIYSNRLNLGRFRTEENILWSFAPHDISVILLLMGGEMPRQVSAHGGYYLHQDIADVTLTTMTFKDAVRGHIFVSWLHPYKEQKLVVVGDRRMAVFDDTAPKDKLLLYSHEIEWVDRKPVPHRKTAQVTEVPLDEPLKIECQDFLSSMETRQSPRVDGQKGLQVLQILSACQRSLESGGHTVDLADTEEAFFVHETSVVEKPCDIGDGTRIWHFSHLMPDVTVGKKCFLCLHQCHQPQEPRLKKT